MSWKEFLVLWLVSAVGIFIAIKTHEHLTAPEQPTFDPNAPVVEVLAIARIQDFLKATGVDRYDPGEIDNRINELETGGA